MKKVMSVILASCALACAALAGSANPPTTVLSVTHGPPSDGSNAVHRLTFGSGTSGGTFRLKVGPETGGPVAWSANNSVLVANVQAAIRGLPTVGAQGCTVTAVSGLAAGIGSIDIEYTGRKAGKLLMPATAVLSNNLTGTTHTLTASTVSPGVTADGRAFNQGAICLDVDSKIMYVTSSPGPDVAWEPIGVGPQGEEGESGEHLSLATYTNGGNPIETGAAQLNANSGDFAIEMLSGVENGLLAVIIKTGSGVVTLTKAAGDGAILHDQTSSATLVVPAGREELVFIRVNSGTQWWLVSQHHGT